MRTGDRAGAAGAAVVEIDEPEASLDLDVAAAVRAGARAVRLGAVCRLSADEPRATLALIRLLRESASDGLPVSWRGRMGDGIDPGLLVHLPPPGPKMGDEVDAALAEWRQRYRPGLCYYRLGPGFVFVKDVRQPGAAARFLLQGERVEAFLALEAVVEVATLGRATSSVLEELEAEGLLLRLHGLATILPHRMRRWPVPSLEV